MDIIEKKINLDDIDIQLLLGPNDAYLNLIERSFNSFINIRGNVLNIKGSEDEVKVIEKVFGELSFVIRKNKTLEENDIITVLQLVSETELIESTNNRLMNPKDKIIYRGFKDVIRARNNKQVAYVNNVEHNDMVFAIGPAGTGKTFLAVAIALAELKKNIISKIILSRPAVEAGESLGFLPGDLKEKLDPYLRPLLDALFLMVGPDKLKSMMEKNIIEIIPLAYMRGRTLSNSFIILDEAQNATVTQMKMFLTRMGENSKVIVTGDITQIDLPNHANSGLLHVNKVLQNIVGIKFIYFDEKDVVRHKLVTEIIKAYEKDFQQSRNITETEEIND